MAGLRDLRPRKPLTVLAFIVLLVASGTTFAMTEAGHIGKYDSGSVYGTVENYHLEDRDGGQVIVATITVENPLMRPITLTTTELTGSVSGDKVAEDVTSYLDVTVPAGGSKTLTVDFVPKPNKQTRAYSATKSKSLVISGVINAKLERLDIDVDVDNGSASQAALEVAPNE